MKYKGFTHNSRTFIWLDGDLYKLPYTSHFRSYGVRKCAKWRDGHVLGNGIVKSASQLEAMTTDIETDFEFHKTKDTPF